MNLNKLNWSCFSKRLNRNISRSFRCEYGFSLDLEGAKGKRKRMFSDDMLIYRHNIIGNSMLILMRHCIYHIYFIFKL